MQLPALTLVALACLAGSAMAQNSSSIIPEVNLGMGNESIADMQPFNPREAISNLVEYQTEHPDFASDIAMWIFIGSILFTIGFILFLFSEIRAVLVLRSRDFRNKLTENYMRAGENIQHREEKESTTLEWRPYVTVASVMIMLLSMVCFLYPICDVIAVIGLPSAPCMLILTFGSFFATICLATFWMAVVWSCTRPLTALVFFAISITGQIMLPTGNPILIFIWAIVALVGGGAYFWFYNDIGDFTVSNDPTKWSGAFAKAGEAEYQEIKAKAADQQRYFEEQQKKLTENTALLSGNK